MKNPPSSKGINNNYSGNSTRLLDCKGDLETVILTPDRDNDIIAVLNPSLNPIPVDGTIPFIYRQENLLAPLEDKSFENLTAFDRESVIMYTNLLDPITLSNEKRMIIEPEFHYECFGCEDPRLTRIDNTYYIVYTGFNGLSASICLATTKDFKTITKHGIIGPNITIKRALEIVEDGKIKQKLEEDYSKLGEKLQNLKRNFPRLQETLENINPDDVKISNKNAALYYNSDTRQFELDNRFFPFAQISIARSIKDFQKTDYWEDQLAHSNKYTQVRTSGPYNKSGKFSSHVGLGSRFKLGDKKVALLHGVDKDINYYGTFVEIKNGRVVSMIQDPLLIPKEDDFFAYRNEKGETKVKGVVFPTAVLVDEGAGRVYVYYGSGDRQIKMRSTSIGWLYEQLNDPYNRIAVA